MSEIRWFGAYVPDTNAALVERRHPLKFYVDTDTTEDEEVEE